MNYLILFASETIHIWLEMSFYILIGLFCAGLLHVFVSKDFIARQLGRGGIASVIKATLVGIPLPVCSCGVIPLAQSLKKEGAHRSSVISFLVSAPATGIDSILATYSLLGPLFAIFRPFADLCTGIVAGTVDYILGGKHEKDTVNVPHIHQKTSTVYKAQEFVRYSVTELPQDIGKWLVIGTVVGGAITAMIPRQLFERFFSYPFDFLAALGVGVPLYVCATGSIPIATSLIQKGFTPGAALVFLITGPATNIVTMAFIRSQFGKKAFYIYLFSLVVVSVVLGLLFNFLWGLFGNDVKLISGAGKALPGSLKAVSGIILLCIIARVWVQQRGMCQNGSVLRLRLSDLHCGSCKMVIEERLSKLPGVEKVSVNVRHKIVEISGSASLEDVRRTIEEAGYHTELPPASASGECHERKCCG